jgi:Fe-S-cluster-containing dehydrogenase component
MPETRESLPVLQPAGEPEPRGRRDFLAGAARLSTGALVFFTFERAEANPAAPPRAAAAEYNWEEHRWAYVIDTQKCIGCGSCVRACKAENGVPDDFYRTWVERYAVGLEHEPTPRTLAHVDSDKGGLEGFAPLQVGFTVTKSFFVPKMCNHCAATPCTQVCPVGASYRTRDGVVLVDAKRCIGCAYCVQACPYGSRFLSPVTHTAEKCTWCYHRITKGLRPACVEVCPTQTRLFGDMKREDDPVRKIIETERVEILQAHLLTEPQCYYLHLDKEVR